MTAISAPDKRSLRARVWEVLDHDHLDSHDQDRLGRWVEDGITWLIIINVICLMCESVPSLDAKYGGPFRTVETFSILIFTIEYLARMWSCVEHPDYRHPLKGRVRYALKPAILIDFLSILPFFLAVGGVEDARFLRLLRVFRVIRLFRSSRYRRPLLLIQRSMARRGEEIVISTMMLLILILIAASVMYAVEHDAQPEAFASIPGTLWWAVVTLTTVGYGDVYPITTLGRIAAGAISVLGIGMVALPTGIISSGFVEEFTIEREQQKSAELGHHACPHCGKPVAPVED